LIPQLKPTELAAWRADASREPPVLVDVREPWEVALCRIEGALAIPLNQLPARVAELPRDRDLVFYCHHGMRSQNAALWLERSGYDRLFNLRGGVDAWAAEVEPAMPRY
jgi:rhodanese-related sulfurtransferase